jgi:hypothetical protein
VVANIWLGNMRLPYSVASWSNRPSGLSIEPCSPDRAGYSILNSEAGSSCNPIPYSGGTGTWSCGGVPVNVQILVRRV